MNMMMKSSRSSLALLGAVSVVCVVAFLSSEQSSTKLRHRRLGSPAPWIDTIEVVPSNDILENVTYSQLRDAVIAQYFASHPGVTNKDQQLAGALRAMKKVEEDGEPIPIDGVDGLYVGSVGAAYNLEALQDEGITHILSLTDSAICKFPDQFDCLHIDGLTDNEAPENRISQYFDKTLPFIENALEEGGRVLVHCWKGKSRSVSTVAAYLIQSEHVSPKEALEQIRVNRPKAKPNKGYMKELDDFYEVIQRQRATSSDDP